ncbi:MAG TPA: hypothetical protein DDZ88_19720 [Verrucomicrobiales bacterium]|nr:hypothetical protein [Verrucomicrobiales bacterium]
MLIMPPGSFSTRLRGTAGDGMKELPHSFKAKARMRRQGAPGFVFRSWMISARSGWPFLFCMRLVRAVFVKQVDQKLVLPALDVQVWHHVIPNHPLELFNEARQLYRLKP